MSGVSCLLRSCSPSAISGRIAALIVDAVNAAVWRSLTHVGKKVLKFVPALAYRDASPAVIFIGFRVRVIATGEHAGPRHEGRRALTASVPVFKIIAFIKKAATRFRIAVLQAVATNDSPIPAIAGAKPIRLPTSASVREFKNGQATMLLARNINEFGHVRTVSPYCEQFKMSQPPGGAV